MGTNLLNDFLTVPYLDMSPPGGEPADVSRLDFACDKPKLPLP